MSMQERITPRARTREVRRPVFVARAKVGNGWQTIGAAWELRGDQEGFSVKLNSIPVGAWEGQFVLIKPLENGDETTPQE